ncbi:RNA-binding protein MEX3B isoform X1 [Anguilla rostrata]|uniref:RNA-binding protein MEX3B isoform X1 n=2 Tax=Anguilla rostrata TaxID=7938 RepID=UPI0030CC386B
MPSPLFHLEIMEHEMVNAQHNGVSLPGETDAESRDEEHQEALRFAFDQLSLMAVEKGDCGGGAGLVDTLDAPSSISETCNGVGGGGYVGLQMLEHANGSLGSPTSCSPSPEYYGTGGYHMAGPHSMLGEPNSVLCSRKRSVNMTECVPVPSSEHVAEIVGRQGCKIKALRAKTNTYIKTPVRGEEPVFIVTGRREDVEMAKREILSAAEHFSMIRASRCKAGAAGAAGAGSLPGPPHLPGQVTIQVRVPYRVVGLVVGPKGATIKRIQQQTHTYIVTPSREKDPVFEVTGMPENVDRAREEIETHITLRTGAFVDLQGDNDFHSNGTDVSLEGLSSLGLGAALWSRANPPTATPPPPPPPPPPPGRKMSSAAFHAAGLGSESCGGGGVAGARGPPENGSPTSPFSTGSGGGGFTFAGDPSPCLPPAPPSAADELGFEFGSAHIWAPFANGGPQQRRNSSGPGGGASGTTPRLSPTLPAEPALEHPLARRAQSDPLSALSWLQAGGAASFSGGSSSSSGGSTTGYSSSCSASSLPGGSPTDSEGGGSGVGGAGAGLLSRFKAGGVVAAAVGGGAGMALAAANRDCYVCLESEVTAALVPCGHNLFCMDCAGHICQSSDPECPVCRTPATQCIRIFS